MRRREGRVRSVSRTAKRDWTTGFVRRSWRAMSSCPNGRTRCGVCNHKAVRRRARAAETVEDIDIDEDVSEPIEAIP